MPASKLKVMTVVGTRPEIIRLSSVIRELDKHCEQVLVHTGQNYDFTLNQVFFDDLGVRPPNYYLDSGAGSKSVAETIAKVITGTDELIEKTKPDAFLILGDTNSCLSAISAKRRKVPIFHMEAGNRCFDARVPEEINRKLVDHLADINLPYSSIAREYLLREGIPPDTVIRTGSPMKEVLLGALPKAISSDVLTRLGLQQQEFFLVSAHREENVEPDSMFSKLIDLLNVLATEFGKPVIVSTHPRLRKRLKVSTKQTQPLIKFIEPLGFFDYIKLQVSALAVLSDSGTISEESSILAFPALNLRESHERPEAMEEASVPMVGLNADSVMRGLRLVRLHQEMKEKAFSTPLDYSYDNVSKKVVRIIHSYVDYVNARTWKK